MVDEEATDGGITVGQRLKEAREAQGLGIEDVAATTRIPTRHLESIELGAWDQLPAPTYTMGFAKAYATTLGLDRTEIADQLRAEMGTLRPTQPPPVDLFEAADPKRSMPKGLVLGAIGAVILLALLLTWLNSRSLQGEDEVANLAAPETNLVAAAPAAATPAGSGPVVITANEAAWIDVRDGATVLKQGELAAGQSFEVPLTATAPTLTTAKPEALRISVGTADAPAIGPDGTKVSKVSLLPADLLRGPGAGPIAAAPTPAAAPPPARRTSTVTQRRTPTPRPRAVQRATPTPVAPAPAPVTTAPPGNTAG